MATPMSSAATPTWRGACASCGRQPHDLARRGDHALSLRGLRPQEPRRRCRRARARQAASPSRFPGGNALIDYRGGTGTFPSVRSGRSCAAACPPASSAARSSSSARRRRASRTCTRHRRAAASSCQAPSPGERHLDGPARQPADERTRWLTALAVLLAALLAPLAALRLGVVKSALIALRRRRARARPVAFDNGVVIVVTAPLAASGSAPRACWRPATSPPAPTGRLLGWTVAAAPNSCAMPSSRSSPGSRRPPNRATATPASTSTASATSASGSRCRSASTRRGVHASPRQRTPRRRQDRHSRQRPPEAGCARRGRVADHAIPHGEGRRDPCGIELAADPDGRGDRANPPRALGRHRLPERPEGRGDPARGSHLRDLRRLRRARSERPYKEAWPLRASSRRSRRAAAATSIPRSSRRSSSSPRNSVRVRARDSATPSTSTPCRRCSSPRCKKSQSRVSRPYESVLDADADRRRTRTGRSRAPRMPRRRRRSPGTSMAAPRSPATITSVPPKMPSGIAVKEGLDALARRVAPGERSAP